MVPQVRSSRESDCCRGADRCSGRAAGSGRRFHTARSHARSSRPCVRRQTAPSALPAGSPSAVTAAPSAKSTFGCWPVSCFAANATAATRAPKRAAPRRSRRGWRGRAGRPRDRADGRAPADRSPRASRAAITGIGSALSPISPNSASARAEAPPCRRPDKRTERRRDDGIRRRAGRGNDAGDKSRRVQLVVGQQHENAADQIGARVVEAPRSGELTVHR